MKNKRITKQEIVAEYLTGNLSYRALGKKYGMSHKTLYDWVQSSTGKNFKRKRQLIEPSQEESSNIQAPAAEIKKLKTSLEESKLKNKLLEEMLRLCEEQTGLPLRKKFGAKQ